MAVEWFTSCRSEVKVVVSHSSLKLTTTVEHGRIDRSGISRGGGCSLIVTSSSFENDRLGSAAIE